ncbi:MAG: tetratricopeptide repeat protein [Chitinophagales bacterium]|nr:tetratricopeptide repeat protein [Chitinophagales bacterium]MDW8418277.1 tetratricopeptide repeat protein [Chitinophagales bacterium]
MSKSAPKAAGKSAKQPVAAKEIVLTPLLPEPLAKKIFVAIAALLLVLMVSVSHQYGISGDENFHRVYGHHIVDFYKTLGKDKTAISEQGPDSLMIYYGGLFDGSTALLSRAFPGINEWHIRHAVNAAYGWAAMVFAGLVAMEIMGWNAAVIVLVFMLFSPRFFGESMNNPKDITMATGYMIAYFFIIRFLKALPRPSWKTTLALGAAIALAMGIRIGGLLLIPYLLLFFALSTVQRFGFGVFFNTSEFRENVWPGLRMVLIASVIGYFGSLILWPYGLVNPLTGPFTALSVAAKFPVQIRILFDGAQINSTEVPWYYEPKWLLISTPLVILIGFVKSVVLPTALKKEKKTLYIGFLYFTIIFPIAYIIYKKSVLYDGMRHIYFVYPSIVILAGLAVHYLLLRLQKPMKFVALGVTVALLALPARWMFANHPNQYVYFNELAGGIQKAHINFETDYYMNSVKQAADWLRANEKLTARDGRKLKLFTNAVAPCNFYFMPDSQHVSVGYVSYRNRTTVDADYLILYSRFVDRELLINHCYPPEQTLHTITADGVPLCAVIKKTDKSDYLGYEALQRGDYEQAVRLLEPYCAKYPKADMALTNLGLAYLQTVRTDPSRLQKAVQTLTATLQLNRDNPYAINLLAAAYEMSGDQTQAQYLRSLINR